MYSERRIRRRQFLRGAAAGGAGLAAVAVVGCGGGNDPRPATTVETGAAQTSPSSVPASPSAVGAPATATAAATVAAPGGPSLAWQRLGSERGPSPRKDHALAADPAGEKVYLFGGRQSGQPQGDLWIYTVTAQSWVRLGPPFISGATPEPRFGHNAVVDPASGRLVVFGGQAGAAFFDDAWAYEPRDNMWRRLPAKGPSPRYGAGSAFDPAAGRLYVSHGFTNQGRFDDTWGLSLAGEAWSDASPRTGPRPLKRCLLRCGWDAANKQVILFGGQSNTRAFHSDLWLQDAKSAAWREVTGPGPSARNLYGAAPDPERGRFWVIGGRTAEGDMGDAWAFDFASERWVKAAPAGEQFVARNGHDAVLLPGRNAILVVGGAAGDGELNDVWRLRLE